MTKLVMRDNTYTEFPELLQNKTWKKKAKTNRQHYSTRSSHWWFISMQTRSSLSSKPDPNLILQCTNRAEKSSSWLDLDRNYSWLESLKRLHKLESGTTIDPSKRQNQDKPTPKIRAHRDEGFDHERPPDEGDAVPRHKRDKIILINFWTTASGPSQ